MLLFLLLDFALNVQLRSALLGLLHRWGGFGYLLFLYFGWLFLLVPSEGAVFEEEVEDEEAGGEEGEAEDSDAGGESGGEGGLVALLLEGAVADLLAGGDAAGGTAATAVFHRLLLF